MNNTKKLFTAAHILLFGLFSFLTIYGAGEVDTSFNATVSHTSSGFVGQSVIQPDGKIIISGEFTMVNGKERINLARLNPDGSLDTTFNPPPIVSAGAGWAINSVLLQSDGKIIIAGQFAQIGTINRRGIARLNPDGSPDSSFNSNPSLDNLFYVYDAEILPDDKIVYGGENLMGSQSVMTVLNADGSLSASINFGGLKFAVQPDGKILVGTGLSTIRRYNQDLSPDASFTEVSYIGAALNDIAVQPDGKVVIGGNFAQINGFNLENLARLNSDGTIDTAFNTNNDGPNLPVTKIVALSDGKLLIGGIFTQYNSAPSLTIARLDVDGTLDKSFNNTRPYQSIYDLDVQTDGKVLVSSTSMFNDLSQVERLNPDGSPDATFQTWVGVYAIGHKVLVQPNGKILMTGNFENSNSEVAYGLTRFLADGSTDLIFNQNYDNGQVSGFFALALQSDSKIIVGSSNFGFNPLRLNPDGSLDTVISIPGSGSNDISIQPDGKIIFAGHITVNQELTRVNPNGSLDASLVVQANQQITKVIALPDTRMLVAGDFTQINGVNRGRIARLFSDGTVDTTFNPPLGANGIIYDMVLQSDGKILIGGAFTGVNGDSNRKYLARLNSDGSLDTTFTPILDSLVFTIKPQPDGKILIGGAFSSVNGTQRIRVARLNLNGANDFTFDPGTGANSTVRDIELQADRIILVGEFTRFNGVSAIGIVRLWNDAPPPTFFDYDGDGRADISVFRASENKWYILQSSDLQVVQKVFAQSGDIPVPSDFDGDGKTDLAVFRPSTGDWWFQSSINNAQIQAHWGQAGDIPLPSNFDNTSDISDLVLYRPSNSVWYRYGDTGTLSVMEFGIAEDKPLIGDFDGDGKSDLAVFRPSTGDWWYAASGAGGQFIATHWGATGDIPVPADYDGDGKTDFAVYRPSNGVWYILNSSDGSFTILAFGLSDDKPVAADYDGDGRTDIAVFRPSTGVWYLMQTSAGFGALQFGISTDIPTPNSFIH